jgi:hypothetical protein
VTVTIEDTADHRLDDYRSLNDQAFRRRYEGDELFIAEGYVAIDRLIESDHAIRSVILAPSRVGRFAAHLPTLAAPERRRLRRRAQPDRRRGRFRPAPWRGRLCAATAATQHRGDDSRTPVGSRSSRA